MTKSRLAISAVILTSMFLAGCQSSEPSSSEDASSVINTSESTSVAPSSQAPSSSEASSSSEESTSSEEASSQEPIPQEPDLFFSEYIEGPATNKVLELFNPTDSTLDLSQYSVKLFSNGRLINATDAMSKTLTGTLAAGETFVFYTFHAQGTGDDASLVNAVGAIPTERKWTGSYETSDAISNYNGDDALGLFKNGVLIDVFGVIGHDPGDFWSLTFASGASNTKDVVLTRIPSVDRPSVNAITLSSTEYPNAFNPLEWSAVAYTAAPATHTIGSHVID